jgi:hypothetical protein
VPLDELIADLFTLDARAEPLLDPGSPDDQVGNDSADCTNDTCTRTCAGCKG